MFFRNGPYADEQRARNVHWLCCVLNSEWMAASFSQHNVSLLSQSQVYLPHHSEVTLPAIFLSLLSPLLTSLAWPTRLASFLLVSHVPLSLSVPSLILVTQTVSSPPRLSSFSNSLFLKSSPLLYSCFFCGFQVLMSLWILSVKKNKWTK